MASSPSGPDAIARTRCVCGVAWPLAGAVVDPSECVVGYKSETRVAVESKPGLLSVAPGREPQPRPGCPDIAISRAASNHASPLPTSDQRLASSARSTVTSRAGPERAHGVGTGVGTVLCSHQDETGRAREEISETKGETCGSGEDINVERPLQLSVPLGRTRARRDARPCRPRRVSWKRETGGHDKCPVSVLVGEEADALEPGGPDRYWQPTNRVLQEARKRKGRAPLSTRKRLQEKKKGDVVLDGRISGSAPCSEARRP